MSAELYRRLGKDSAIVKVAQPGNERALRGSVRWELAQLTPRPDRARPKERLDARRLRG
jgi:hypothetical protein